MDRDIKPTSYILFISSLFLVNSDTVLKALKMKSLKITCSLVDHTVQLHCVSMFRGGKQFICIDKHPGQSYFMM